jgi:hypothetical protein
VPFANLVSVSFSAFDEFRAATEGPNPKNGLRCTYIGLKREESSSEGLQEPKSPQMLANEFMHSIGLCLTGTRAPRWRKAVETLEADPLFKDEDVSALAFDGEYPPDNWASHATELFSGLSSGHKIVLLTITRLVETVNEKTLILLDEPESHLHPPLLSSFIRALSDLLVNRNGVAIIATHSPVVLQEVPRECVWILQRTGHAVGAGRPEVETFGENVGVLTREVFGLEVVQSGFHQLLKDASERYSSFEGAVEEFNDHLGGEARAILRGLLLTK